jgi:hypothetical protein
MYPTGATLPVGTLCIGDPKKTICSTELYLQPHREDVWGSGDKDPFIVTIGAKWKLVSNFTYRPIYTDICCVKRVDGSPEPAWMWWPTEGPLWDHVNLL